MHVPMCIYTHICIYVWCICMKPVVYTCICVYVSYWFYFSCVTLADTITIPHYIISSFLSYQTISIIKTGMVSVLFALVFLVPRIYYMLKSY